MNRGTISINPEAPDDWWVSPSGSDCWCTVGMLKELKKSDNIFRQVIEKLAADNGGTVPNWLLDFGAPPLLWCVHVLGPDDIIAMPSKERADLHAAKINKSVGRQWEEGDPEINAIVEPWPYSPETHEKALFEVLEAERKLAESV